MQRDSGHSRMARSVAAAAVGVFALVGCTSDPEVVRPTVTPTNASIAIVRWEIERNEPVIDADGNVETPVIYLAAGAGGTVDVGVQASVIATIDDTAVIRFVDDARDARDEGLDNEPVKDDGVMILIGEFEADQTKIDARIVRYVSNDDVQEWTLSITATDDGATVDSEALATD